MYNPPSHCDAGQRRCSWTTLRMKHIRWNYAFPLNTRPVHVPSYQEFELLSCLVSLFLPDGRSSGQLSQLKLGVCFSFFSTFHLSSTWKSMMPQNCASVAMVMLDIRINENTRKCTKMIGSYLTPLSRTKTQRVRSWNLETTWNRSKCFFFVRFSRYALLLFWQYASA